MPVTTPNPTRKVKIPKIEILEFEALRVLMRAAT